MPSEPLRLHVLPLRPVCLATRRLSNGLFGGETRNLAGVTSFFATRLWNVIDNNRRLCSGALKGGVFHNIEGDVQVADPAGTATVSPSFGEATADLTSPNETLFALIVAPSTWPK